MHWLTHRRFCRTTCLLSWLCFPASSNSGLPVSPFLAGRAYTAEPTHVHAVTLTGIPASSYLFVWSTPQVPSSRRVVCAPWLWLSYLCSWHFSHLTMPSSFWPPLLLVWLSQLPLLVSWLVHSSQFPTSGVPWATQSTSTYPDTPNTVATSTSLTPVIACVWCSPALPVWID